MLTEHAAQSWVFTVFVINEKPDARLSSLTPLTPKRFVAQRNVFQRAVVFAFWKL